MTLTRRPTALVILDGFGLAEASPGNAVALASTPVFDHWQAQGPATSLAASGREVGLPEGQIGNSEVGHLNIGAGRVVLQSLTFIDEEIASGSFFGNPVLADAAARAGGGTLHLLGLVSDGGVHSSLGHLLALIELAGRQDVEETVIHVFTDGRDTAPDSSLAALLEVEAACRAAPGRVRIGSVCGRYYAMDRDHRWERTARAFDLLVHGRAPHSARTAEEAVRAAWARGETDEFIEPTVIIDDAGEPVGRIRDGDSLIFFNFRADRARQLTEALTAPADWPAFNRGAVPGVHFASLMQYDSAWPFPFAFSLPELELPLAEVISRAGLSQFHAAETEKYAHVTYFFNAFQEEPFPGEERSLTPSPKVATYDLQPEMSAAALTDAVVARIGEGIPDFILVNYANPDMVGHTGSLEAAIRACEAADSGLGRLVTAVLQAGGCLLVIADHGNAEMMLEADGVSPHTAHTTNPVPCLLIGGPEGAGLRDGGRLADVAPTVLELLGVEQPAVMTGRSLLVPA